MKRQTWLRYRIPTNTRAPLAAYTCSIMGQISRHGGIMWCGRNDSFNHGEGIRRKSLLLSGCLRPLARSLCHYFDLMPARLTAALHRARLGADGVRNSCGERGRGSEPMRARTDCEVCDFRPSCMAALSLLTMSVGVPVGANTPVQKIETKSGTLALDHGRQVCNGWPALRCRHRKGFQLLFLDQWQRDRDVGECELRLLGEHGRQHLRGRVLVHRTRSTNLIARLFRPV